MVTVPAAAAMAGEPARAAMSSRGCTRTRVARRERRPRVGQSRGSSASRRTSVLPASHAATAGVAVAAKGRGIQAEPLRERGDGVGRAAAQRAGRLRR